MNRRYLSILAGWILFCLAANSVVAAESVSLAGEWRFALDRNDVATNENWFAKSLPDKIQLPGILEAQGYGDEISTTTPWVLSLYDHFWFLRADYAAYTNVGSVKVPFLSQPERHYLGAAWYQREIEIHPNWNGQRIVLFLERPHWQSTVWLDDKEIGSDISLCTPHEYDFGRLTTGKHRLTIRVDNRLILPYRPDSHSISDSLDNAWNGIIGKIELRATSPVWIDDVQIFPDLKTKSVMLKGKIKNLTHHAGQDKMILFVGYPGGNDQPLAQKNITINWSTNGGEFETSFNLSPTVEPWDEFHPNLYVLNFYLEKQSLDQDGTIVGNSIQFGLRDLHTDGNQFSLNSHPLYLRGTHFGGDFPLTGYPATDVATWKKIFQTCKNYGLNSMRFHSWCPPEAAFTAADELGFYLYVEPGMWNTFNPGLPMETMLYSETERIIKTYGNHPSFLMLSPSNEPKGHWQEVLPKWSAHFRAVDPLRLYTSGTGFTDANAPGQLDQVDFTTTGRIGDQRVRGESGWFGRDYAGAVAGIKVPVIAHELGQWCAYPDFDVIKKFTGFMRPGNFEIFRDSLAAHGLLDKDKDFAAASGKFQLECYKEEIEANLRTPGLAGFQLLDLHDYTGQGTALVGLLDPFWESKGYVTPEEFRKFCGPVVPLAWLNKRVFTTDKKLEADIGLANFSAETLKQAYVMWTIYSQDGKQVAGGFVNGPLRNLPVGFKDKLYHFSTGLTHLPAPAQYKLVAYQLTLSTNLTNENIRNDWNFWLYPAHISGAVPTNILVTSSWNNAEKKLAAGGKVLFLPPNADLDWSSPPLARAPIFWNALMGPTWSRMLGLWCDTNSPALAEFPTEANCDWQWTELLRNTRAVNLDLLPRGLQPIVSAIDDWNRNDKLGVIFEAQVGTGKLLVCSIDLNGNSNPVAQQLRRSLLDYMAGEKFRPATKISPADFENLYFDTRIMHKLGATAKADGKSAGEIVDGDPNTFWSSADARGKTSKPPHTIEISFPQAIALDGLVLMPRQNQREHQGDIRDYKIEASDAGQNWREINRGQLASTWNPQKILFNRTITAKTLKLTALTGFGNDNSAALAELAVIYAGQKFPETRNDEMEYKNVQTASPDIDAGILTIKSNRKPQ